MKTMNKKIISCVLLIALIAIPLTGCVGNLPPTAGFTYSPLTPTTDDSILFTDSSTDGDGNIASWAWDFGDGNTSTSYYQKSIPWDVGCYTITSIRLVVRNSIWEVIGELIVFGTEPIDTTDPCTQQQ